MNLSERPYSMFPKTDITGNAGTLAPGEREQRYTAYEERRMEKHDGEQVDKQ